MRHLEGISGEEMDKPNGHSVSSETILRALCQTLLEELHEPFQISERREIAMRHLREAYEEGAKNVGYLKVSLVAGSGDEAQREENVDFTPIVSSPVRSDEWVAHGAEVGLAEGE